MAEAPQTEATDHRPEGAPFTAMGSRIESPAAMWSLSRTGFRVTPQAARGGGSPRTLNGLSRSRDNGRTKRGVMQTVTGCGPDSILIHRKRLEKEGHGG